jgi:hypothetical protein
MTQIPILVNHLCREKVENACDIGRPVSVLKNEFPQFDFSRVPNIWWFTNEHVVTEENYQTIFKEHRYTEPLGINNISFLVCIEIKRERKREREREREKYTFISCCFVFEMKMFFI